MCASHYKKYLDDKDSVKTINHYSFKSIAEKSSDANNIFFTYEDFQRIYEKWTKNENENENESENQHVGRQSPLRTLVYGDKRCHFARHDRKCAREGIVKNEKTPQWVPAIRKKAFREDQAIGEREHKQGSDVYMRGTMEKK